MHHGKEYAQYLMSGQALGCCQGKKKRRIWPCSPLKVALNRSRKLGLLKLCHTIFGGSQISLIQDGIYVYFLIQIQNLLNKEVPPDQFEEHIMKTKSPASSLSYSNLNFRSHSV